MSFFLLFLNNKRVILLDNIIGLKQQNALFRKQNQELKHEDFSNRP